MIRIASYIDDSIVDGPGIRFTIFFQGCDHKCKGCFNPETRDFNKGTLIEEEELFNRIKENPLLSGVTFSGGDPFYQIKGALSLAKLIKTTNLNIFAYTGFLYEELLEKAKSDKDLDELLHLVDYLVDGPFILEQKDISLRYRGSKNQRIIDLKKSLNERKIVIKDFDSLLY